MLGSSPLARGLLHRGQAALVEFRIIPARAGFTFCADSLALSCPDHPRSRGVYSPPSSPASTPMGSSPLARGLRQIGDGINPRTRIIPARAGFTTEHGSSRTPHRDHPRSRGVYHSTTSIGFPLDGSSPLARGLHNRERVSQLGARIIPARAGFTLSETILTFFPADHPRSRGVYSEVDHWLRPLPGSSPLARGLHSHRHSSRASLGIIPARAGFTRRSPGRGP